MSLFHKKNAFLAGVTALIFAFPAYGNINKSVRIADGATSTGASSVNGSVTVGDNATVTGDLSTVNGSIRIGEGSVVELRGRRVESAARVDRHQFVARRCAAG